MPQSTIISAYPVHFFRILSSGLSGVEIDLDLGTESAAKNLRFKFYGFRKALFKEGHPQAREAMSLNLRVRGSHLLISQADEHTESILAQLDEQLGVERFPAVPTVSDGLDADVLAAQEHDEADSLLAKGADGEADRQAQLISDYFGRSGDNG